MKIQELAIIFVIIILPISILLSEYTQFQIQTIKTQTEYDAKLTAATYDAIKAFQLNAQNETYSDIANQRVQNIETSVNSFRNSIMSGFKLNGYTEEELNNYIPALVYTLYDGLYIYSPYENTNYRYEYEVDSNTGEIKKDRYTGEPIYAKDESGNKIPTEGNGQNLYGLKPYITYSCRYKKGNIDVVITYALDNYITVQGMIGNEYVNKGGYLIDNITVTNQEVSYNGVKIEAEQLKENVGGNTYKYVKRNGTKYYWVNNQIVYISNGIVKIQCSEGDSLYTHWVNLIDNNTYAQQYYKDAKEFTEWFKSTNLVNLTYNDAYDEVINEYTGETNIYQMWLNDSRPIFVDGENNIENELSNFNQHRLAVIRHKIETNLAIAISNYNSYSNVKNVFQMQQLKEDEWEHITHNISVISFLQGLPIGGKVYNGYTIVTNSESEEVVLEQNIYMLGKDKNYHKIGDNNFEVDDSGIYGSKISTGRLNTDFKRTALTNSEGYQTLYYYPLKAYNASYNSIVMQNDVTTYDDIYMYVNSQNDDLKKAFYTALGRERASCYSSNDVGAFAGLYVPEGYHIVSGTNFKTGVVIEEDRTGNQFVWIEVPKTTIIYKTAGLNITSFTDEEFRKIENDLKDYTNENRVGEVNSYNDEYYSDELTGLDKDEYYNQKKKMLKSIYLNAGFYIGRYETGIDYNQGSRTAAGSTTQTPVIKQNAYVYNYVSVSQAQELSRKFKTSDCTSSLMFKVQSDLVMKYLQTKGATIYELNDNSTNWGNYKNHNYTITNADAKYSTDDGYSYNSVQDSYTKSEERNVLLTTGASNKFAKQNIYDLAGNVYEWNLSYCTVDKTPSNNRGGSYWTNGDERHASYDGGSKLGYVRSSCGFRVTLYKDEGPALNRESLAPAYIPDGYTHVPGTNMGNGYVVADNKGNEYVWVEVPKTLTVYPTAGLTITSFTDEEFKKIENDLHTYTSVYRDGKGEDRHYSDETTGLTQNQYNTQKKKMLKSIYINGGFYVGRYETGIDYSQGARTEPGTTTQTPVIKQNAYPYNYATNSQSQVLSQSFATDGYASSLMFGVQWDLVLKYLETKGVTQNELTNGSYSKSVGNQYNTALTITNLNAKYSTDNCATWTSEIPYNKKAATSVGLSTGASNNFSMQNISDLTGNMWEWTLEYTGSTVNSCSCRGGGYNSINYYASIHGSDAPNECYPNGGFRVSLYKDEGPELKDEMPAYIPEGYIHVSGTTMENGYVVQDSKGNQYVWVEVPKTLMVYPTAGLTITSFTDDEYRKIENDLKTYTTLYRNNTEYIDDNFQPATGLTDIQYNNQKKKMLKSIYKYGGFYVGRYETGIDYNEEPRTTTGDTTQTPVIKQNAYPYNFVTTSQAQALASNFATNGVTSSLMFGVQWDLILKYMEMKGSTQSELNSDSTNWGNFKTNTYNITNINSKYTTDATSWINGAYGQKDSSTTIILTTGASESFKKQNIYDFAGNVGEKTLERTGESSKPSSGRGSWWMDEGTHDNRASSRTKSLATHANRSFGFRVSLYRDEGI